MKARLYAALRAALILAAVALVHGGRIVANFSAPQWEDKLFLGHVAKNVHSLGDVFTHGSFWTGLYRPLSTNLFYFLIGDRIRALHVALLIVHLVNLFLLYRVARCLLSEWYATFACVLFASRLAHAEAVLYASQMQTLLPETFTLLALWAYARGLERNRDWKHLALACAAIVLAFLAKESSVTVFAVLLAYRLFFAGDRRQLAYWITPAAITGAYALLLAFVLPHVVGVQHYWTYVFSYGAVSGNIAAHLLSYSDVLLHPIRLHYPAIFVSEYPAIVRWSFSWPMHIFVGASALASFVPLFLRTNKDLRIVAFAFLWFLLSVAPVVFFHNRLLLYYGYAGTAALSIGFAALLRWIKLAVTARIAATAAPPNSRPAP
jgi:dolichyl-phosphate-mannose-protein mannosyltransferase